MRKTRTDKRAHEEISFWQSYSDMMAAILLVFILMLTGTLLETRKVFEEKQIELDRQRELIETQQEQINQIVGVRNDLIEALRNEFSGTDLSISVDPQTGSITFDSNLLFGVDRSDLSSDGKRFLREFLPRYFDILLGDSFKVYVAEIIIEGHTDTNGSYMYNLQLSQDRAFAVVSYCLSSKQGLFNEDERAELREIITANGRSWSRPIYMEDGSTVNMDASRRVEIKFRLKDEDMINQIADLLGDER